MCSCSLPCTHCTSTSKLNQICGYMKISPVCSCHVGSNSALQVLARPSLWENCNITSYWNMFNFSPPFSSRSFLTCADNLLLMSFLLSWSVLRGLLNKDVPILNDKGISWTESSLVSVAGDRFAPLVWKNSQDFLRRGFKFFFIPERNKEASLFGKVRF